MNTLQTMSKTVLGIEILFLILLGFSFLVLEPGSASYVAAKLTLLPVLVTLAVTLAVLFTGWDPFK